MHVLISNLLLCVLFIKTLNNFQPVRAESIISVSKVQRRAKLESRGQTTPWLPLRSAYGYSCFSFLWLSHSCFDFYQTTKGLIKVWCLGNPHTDFQLHSVSHLPCRHDNTLMSFFVNDCLYSTRILTKFNTKMCHVSFSHVPNLPITHS